MYKQKIYVSLYVWDSEEVELDVEYKIQPKECETRMCPSHDEEVDFISIKYKGVDVTRFALDLFGYDYLQDIILENE